MTKEELKSLIDVKAQELKDAVDSIVVGGDVAELEAKIVELVESLSVKQSELEVAQVQLSEKSAELESTKSLLADVNAKAKEIDAAIPD